MQAFVEFSQQIVVESILLNSRPKARVWLMFTKPCTPFPSSSYLSSSSPLRLMISFMWAHCPQVHRSWLPELFQADSGERCRASHPNGLKSMPILSRGAPRLQWIEKQFDFIAQQVATLFDAWRCLPLSTYLNFFPSLSHTRSVYSQARFVPDRVFLTCWATN